jgi:hypothetical protein
LGESLFETGYFSNTSPVFGFRPESRLETYADIFECALFFKNAIFFSVQQFHQPSRYGLRSILRGGKRRKHRHRYVDLIEAVINDVGESKTSSYSGAPELWRMETNKAGTCTEFKMILEAHPGVDDSYYRIARFQHTAEREEQYHQSAYYRKHGTGSHYCGAHPTGVCYHTSTGEISLVYGFSPSARLLHDQFSRLAIGVLSDAAFISTWIRTMVATQTPELSDSLSALQVHSELSADGTVRISTNIDIRRMVSYHKHVAPARFPGAEFNEFGDLDEIATPRDILFWLLSPILQEIESLVRTCIAQGTLYHETASLGGLRLLRRMNEQSQICRFVDTVIGEAGSVREKIISGDARPMELLKLYERSERWRQWTSQIGEDSNLVREYVKEIGGDPWIAKLPVKALRFAVTTGAGVGVDLLGAGGVGTAAAVGLGALDHFLIERMAGGYTPREFVNRMSRA